jgi:hypothetical protein
MTESSSEIRELTLQELDAVGGGDGGQCLVPPSGFFGGLWWAIKRNFQNYQGDPKTTD